MRAALRTVLFGRPTSPDSDVRAWINAVRAAGGSVSQARANLLTTYVKAGKANGWWSGLDMLCIYAGEDAATTAIQSTMDLKTLSAHTLINQPTGTANVGFTGDAISKVIATGNNPASGPHYTQNDASYGGWVQSGTGTNGRAYMGSHSTTNNFNRGSATTDGWAVNGGGTTTTMNPANGTGFIHVQRTASNLSTIWQNGISKGTQAGASGAVTSATMLALGSNNGSGTPVNLNEGTLGMAFAGGSLTGVELAFYNDTHTLMTAINSVIYP